MKRFITILSLLLIAAFTVSAQKTAKKTLKKSKPKTSAAKSQITKAEREKFDPLKNPAEDLQSAIVKANNENKRIILDVGGEWCGWCRLMDNYLMKNAELGKLRNENYVWVKINMSEENENKEFLSKYPEATGYPHLYVLEKDGTLLKSKDTSELEQGESYDLQKFTGFLKEFAPVKNAEMK
ncbi:MAG: DUF255 domain-containing protein [Pyrinomonadaceae bacterium]